MARFPGAEAIYEVAELFRQRCLKEGKSLLWPNEPVWTIENLDRLWDKTAEQPDTTSRNFFEKLEEQLRDESALVHMLMTDVMVLYSLPATNFGAEKKIEYITTIQSWKINTPPDEGTWALVQQAFQQGVAHTGTYYLTGRPFQIYFYLDASREYIKRPSELESATTAKAVANSSQAHTKENPNIKSDVPQARHMLLHLLFPDDFERIASTNHKEQIVNGFKAEAKISTDTDIDDALFQIRQYLNDKFERNSIDFYDSDIRPLWDPQTPVSTPDPSPKPKPPTTPIPTPDDTLENLAHVTFLDNRQILEIKSLIRDRRQLIFEGPPGSGKTFVAEKFARWFTGQSLESETPLNEQVEIIQFHQSYGYEVGS